MASRTQQEKEDAFKRYNDVTVTQDTDSETLIKMYDDVSPQYDEVSGSYHPYTHARARARTHTHTHTHTHMHKHFQLLIGPYPRDTPTQTVILWGRGGLLFTNTWW